MEIPTDVGRFGEKAPAQAPVPAPMPGVEAGTGIRSLAGSLASLDAVESLPVQELPPALDALADALVRRLEGLPRA